MKYEIDNKSLKYLQDLYNQLSDESKSNFDDTMRWIRINHPESSTLYIFRALFLVTDVEWWSTYGSKDHLTIESLEKINEYLEYHEKDMIQNLARKKEEKSDG